MKQISTRQIIIMYVIYSVALKFLVVPSMLCKYSGRDMWAATLIATAVEVALLWIVICTLNRLKNTTLSAALKTSLGKVGSKIVLLLLLFLLFIQSVVTIKQTYNLLNNSLYEGFDFLMFIIPTAMLAIYFCVAGARAFFRSGEIFFAAVIIGLVLAVLGAIGFVKPSGVLPILNIGIKPLISAVYYTLEYFSAFIIFLVFAGSIDIKKTFKKAWLTTAAVLGLITVFISFVFYTVFQGLGVLKNQAVVNFAQFINFKGGGLDWIVIIIWVMLLIIQFCVSFYGCYHCLKDIFNAKKIAIIALPLAVVMFVIHAFLIVGINDMYSFLDLLRPISAALTIILPIFIYLLVILNKKKLGLTEGGNV